MTYTPPTFEEIKERCPGHPAPGLGMHGSKWSQLRWVHCETCHRLFLLSRHTRRLPDHGTGLNVCRGPEFAEPFCPTRYSFWVCEKRLKRKRA